MQRRTALKHAAALIGGASATSLLVGAPAARAAETHKQAVSGARVTAREGLAVVETHSGRVAGYLHEGIFTFKGIPYGDTTEGGNRFMPPRKPKPWAGVRSSRQYGARALTPAKHVAGRIDAHREPRLLHETDRVGVRIELGLREPEPGDAAGGIAPDLGQMLEVGLQPHRIDVRRRFDL